MKIIIKYLTLILIFSLPLINSHLLNIFGIDYGFYVDGNYEFSKVIFFNIISATIFFLFVIKSLFDKKEIKIPIFVYFFIMILVISNIFSISPINSFFGGVSKGHGTLMFINLIGIFIVFYNILDKKILKKINKLIAFSSIFVCILAIKEFYQPSFDYGDLGNRAIGTFGHPNYLSLYLLLITPYICRKITKKENKESIRIIYLLVFILITFTLLITKSFIAIFLFFSYSIIIFIRNHNFKELFFLETFKFLFIMIGIVLIFFPDKLSSLLSRFFIWESSLSIIFSNINYFFTGIGLENLSLIFDNHKSQYLYIFENIGFTADRPHNLILNFFIHFGILGLVFISSIYLFVLKSIRKKKFYIHSLVLGLIFLLFNFASIASYIIIVVYLAYLVKNMENSNNPSVLRTASFYIKGSKLINIFLILTLLLFSTIGSFYSIKLYIAETYAYNNNYVKAIEVFPYNSKYYYELGEINKGLKLEKFKSEQYYLAKVYSLKDIKSNCEDLVKNFGVAENFFYCGKLLDDFGYYELSESYYRKGLKLIPDLRNKNSPYYNNLFIKEFINGNRFFSEKYSDLREILRETNNF